MASDSLEPGRILAGRYKLESKLGVGGFGTVWHAEHLVLAAPVAVKVVDREVVHDAETVDRFLREARAAATLRSPHVVQILDYGMDGDVPFMVMELLEGETLAQRLRRIGKLGAAETGRVLTHVARAVARAHAAGIVHRDLKPENVFLVKNEDEEIAKVLDFGVAKVATTHMGPESAHTRTGSLLGTPYYMSPEQAQGNKTVDHRSDLWSLAVIAFECLTGKRPFMSDGLGELVLQICAYPIPVPSEVATVPLGFDRWFKRATDRDPQHRFQSAKDMAESLREVLGLDVRDVSMLPDVAISSASPDDAREEAKTTELKPGAAASEAEEKGGSAAQARAAEGNAPTLIAAPEEGPTLTVRQFGTTHRTGPPSRRSGSGIVIGVAGAALVVGLAAGFAMLSKRTPSIGPIPDGNDVSRTPAVPSPELRRTAGPITPGASDDTASTSPQTNTDAKARSGEHASGASKAGGSTKDAGRTSTKLDGSVMLDRRPPADKPTPEPRPSAQPGPYDDPADDG